MKTWFNRTFPYLRRCLTPWCLRGITYNSRCYRHQNRYH